MVAVRHHLLIAGTGRAGTSFLVRFLHEVGLDTHVGRKGQNAFWDENAGAGYEDHVLWKTDELPYVAKFPWLFEAIDAVLEDPSVLIDGVIIPVRDIHDAAASRVVLELQNRHVQLPQMQSEGRVWEHWASTPGGVIYSLNPIDEARLLAMGFHQLVQRLVLAEVPMHFLAFPRMIEDPDYMIRQLRGCLPPQLDAKDLLAAHARAADLSRVRIGRTQEQNSAESPLEELDRAALGREVTRLRAALSIANAKLKSLTPDPG